MPAPKKPVKMKTLKVSSHLALVSYGGVMVPIGFLASHRKKNHGDCEGGKGFVLRSMPGHPEKVNAVCRCANERALKKYRQVGAAGFEKLAAEWLTAAQKLVAEDQERCRREGYEAALDDLDGSRQCPYPKNSDQALAWEEGRQRSVGLKKASVEAFSAEVGPDLTTPADEGKEDAPCSEG